MGELIYKCYSFFYFCFPNKKRITFIFERQKKLILNTPFIYCGSLVSFFKQHKNNINDFKVVIQDIPRAQDLVNQDKLFLENKNNSLEERCTLLHEARLMEHALESAPEHIMTSWTNLVKCQIKSWNLKDSSNNTSSIYNLLVEKEVFDNASNFLLSRNFTTKYLQNNLPAHLKKQLNGATPDFVATNSQTINLVSANLYDVKGILSPRNTSWDVTTKSKDFEYNLIYHGFYPVEQVTTNILNRPKLGINPGALLYCPKLNTILEAKLEISPITQNPISGWYNFESGVFKSFKDIILP